MVLIRAMVQDFAFGERSTFASLNRTSIFHLMQNLILPFAICILFHILSFVPAIHQSPALLCDHWTKSNYVFT